MDTTTDIEKIKKNILKLPPHKLQQLDEFLENLLKMESTDKSQNVKKLEGIWEGIGFENIDIESEIAKLRTEIDVNLIGNST